MALMRSDNGHDSAEAIIVNGRAKLVLRRGANLTRAEFGIERAEQAIRRIVGDGKSSTFSVEQLTDLIGEAEAE